jgi:hypothetical protein
MQQTLQQLLALQEKAEANRKADLEEMKSDGIVHRECMKQMMARTDDN